MNLFINLKQLTKLQFIVIILSVIAIGLTSVTQLIYLTDLISILLLGIVLFKKRKTSTNKLMLIICFNVVYWFISYIGGSLATITEFVMQVRTLIRPLIFLIAIVECFELKDILKYFKYVDILFVIHCICIVVQRLVLDINIGDYIGGLFGVRFGYGNVVNHFFLLVIGIKTSIDVINNKKSNLWEYIKLILIIIMGLLTEMKSIIFELVFVILILLIFMKISYLKKVSLIFITIVLMVIFGYFLGQMYDFSIFDIESIMKYLSGGYAGNNQGIGRFDGFEKINELFFNNDILLNVFGGGFATGTSNVFNANYPDLNIGNFTYAKMFLDCGILGCALYYILPLWTFGLSIKQIKYNRSLAMFSIFMSIFIIYFTFYGNLMESDFCGYYGFALLSIPFLLNGENNKSKVY